MAHDKVYGICGDKCQVDITGMIVRARFEVDMGVLSADELKVKSIMLMGYGITSNKDINAIISPNISIIDASGYSLIDINHYIDQSGVLIVTAKNKTAKSISDLKLNVAII